MCNEKKGIEWRTRVLARLAVGTGGKPMLQFLHPNWKWLGMSLRAQRQAREAAL